MRNDYQKYLRTLAITIIIMALSTLMINWHIDPLWYVHGNQLFPENYTYHERHAKVNLYLKKPHRYDCILLGSSRTTLLDATKIASYTCFNFSFSAGSPPEFIEYARYVQAKGRIPEFVVVGIDGLNFSRDEHISRTPDFVLAHKEPPYVLTTYLSLDVLAMSIRTLVRDAPLPRYYTDHFIGDVLPNTPKFTPPTCFNLKGYAKPYTLKHIHYYSALKSTFPKAVFIGYVTPISAWDMMAPHQDGTLPTHLKTIYNLSGLFDRFYDFTLPSRITMQVNNTYDGQHYSRSINDRIATIINGGPVEFGISLHDHTYAEYQEVYQQAIKAFVNKLSSPIQFHKNCARRSVAR